MFGVYVHVPFCASRCGYCDFNTYVPGEATREGYVPALLAEIERMRATVGDRPVDTVFLGGGTPTLLDPREIAAILRAIGPARDEVTIEANPETVSPATFDALLEAGVTRVSLGMQHAAPHVLRVLERAHTPGRAVAAAREARAAGLPHVSLDLIYGTPGETREDWARTLDAALSAEPDHVSAYGLVVEPGTKLAAQVRRGEVPAPDPDAMADRYEEADAAFTAAGLPWYEHCNWSRSPCAHNVGYWRGGDWWGAGPGAHSHLDGPRWWNVRHPRAYAERLARGASPEASREVLDEEERRLERIMLELRLRTGVDAALLRPDGLAAAERWIADGGLVRDGARLVLTLRGRQLADAVIRDVTD